MVIVVKDFVWSQTEKTLTVKVPLKGVHQSKVDLFYSPKYLKASYEKYFFEVFLLYSINPEKSTCTLTNENIIFELTKDENLLWETIEVDLPRQQKQEIKKQIIEEEHKKFQEKCEEQKKLKYELKSVAVKEAISLDTIQREKINQIKNEEKTSALGDLNKWQAEMPQNQITDTLSDEEEDDEEEDEIPVRKPIKRIQYKPKKYSLKKFNNNSYQVPLPRTTATLEVSFTPRQFPTPCRESKLEEENEWLKNQAIARRTVGFMSEDLRPEERNPQYLKSKGDEFLKAGNYLAAISAYSFGIKLSDKFVDLYIGRSEAHFALENFHKTVQDCSRALELMKPELGVTFKERLTCITRRGMALCKIGMLREGISELEIAHKMLPTDKEIEKNLLQAIDDLNNKAGSSK